MGAGAFDLDSRFGEQRVSQVRMKAQMESPVRVRSPIPLSVPQFCERRQIQIRATKKPAFRRLGTHDCDVTCNIRSLANSHAEESGIKPRENEYIPAETWSAPPRRSWTEFQSVERWGSFWIRHFAPYDRKLIEMVCLETSGEE